MNRKAFTLIELLVVIAIIAILAAILFPVFAQAKMMAKKANCVSNTKQWNLALPMYLTDFDDMFPVWMANGTFNVQQGDYNLLNITYPYIKNEDLTRTPNDPFTLNDRAINPNFPNPNSMPQPAATEQRRYNLGWLTDYGINYQYMTGLFPASGQPTEVRPGNSSRFGDPANSIAFITGIFNRSTSGSQLDGGQLPIDPPCIQNPDGSSDIIAYQYSGTFYYYGGWNPSQPLAWNVFGGVWPYYSNQATTGFLDGHVKTLSIGQVAAGCDVKDAWGGYITDPAKYLWDTR